METYVDIEKLLTYKTLYKIIWKTPTASLPKRSSV